MQLSDSSPVLILPRISKHGNITTTKPKPRVSCQILPMFEIAVYFKAW